MQFGAYSPAVGELLAGVGRPTAQRTALAAACAIVLALAIAGPAAAVGELPDTGATANGALSAARMRPSLR